MRLVYVAGKFRDLTAWGVHQNVIAAEQQAAIVTKYPSLVAVCPHLMTRNLDPLQDEDYWLAATLEIMRRCDAVFVSPNWRTSIGTLSEIREALLLGKPLFFFEESIRLYAAIESSRLTISLLGIRLPWIHALPENQQISIQRLDLGDIPNAIAVFSCGNTTVNDFGTIPWAFESISWLHARKTIDRVPAGMIAWLDAEIKTLTKKYSQARHNKN